MLYDKDLIGKILCKIEEVLVDEAIVLIIRGITVVVAEDLQEDHQDVTDLVKELMFRNLSIKLQLPLKK